MARTALAIVQAATTKLAVTAPGQLFAATDRTAIELRETLNEAAEQIVRMHDWQLLRTLQTNTGDGSTTEFALPSDYLRMPKDAKVWSSKWQHPLACITPEEWLNLDVRDYDAATGTWTVYGGNMVHKPALDSDETARYWYISDKCVTNSSGTTQAIFTADDDTFRLDDRVLELSLIWLYRAHKGLEYGEHQAAAEMALARTISQDGGARILTQRTRGLIDAETAYPREVPT